MIGSALDLDLRDRDSGRPTGLVVGRYPIRVEEGDGARPGDSGVLCFEMEAAGLVVMSPAW